MEFENIFKCPLTKEKLHLESNLDKDYNGIILEGNLVNESGNTEYPIKDGIPDFTVYNKKDNHKNEYAKALFKEKALIYDKYQHLSFETFFENETDVRNSMIDKLNLNENSKVLEVNAGTGRDSILISKRLSKNGVLHVQDISREMLQVCKNKLENINLSIGIHQGDACRLPYADKTFDAVYSFGGVGMNTYSNNKEAIAELVRVTKTNGKVVFGGLSLAPWLRDTFFGKVLINQNSHYGNELSLSELPVEARNLKLNWILSGAGFVIDFTVGEGEPKANFEYEIPGVRGGTHLTRYLGNLEGVKPETKKMAFEACKKQGVSMHQWLDKLVRQNAEKILNNKKNN